MLSTSSPFITSTSFSIGNGKTTSFWSAHWSGDFLLRNQFPNLHAASALKYLSVSNWIRRFGSGINLGFPIDLCLDDQREVVQLRALIANILFSNAIDLISWRWSKNGKFSVKSAYNFLCFDGRDDRKILHLWGIRIPLKIKIFLWLAARNKLLTAELLAKRGWQGPSICILCRAGEEYLDHLFFNCNYARSLWVGLLQNWPLTCHRLLNFSGDLASRWRGARMTLKGRPKELFDLLISVVCWEL